MTDTTRAMIFELLASLGHALAEIKCDIGGSVTWIERKTGDIVSAVAGTHARMDRLDAVLGQIEGKVGIHG